MPTALHLAPHPDDELTGAPATLMALRDAGYRVVNFACGLGRTEQRARREAELREACRRARFDLEIPDRLVPISRDDDLRAAQGELTGIVREALARHRPAIVLSPSPHDRHHGHEVVARAARDALADVDTRWWMWGVWASLPLPTIGTPFAEPRLDEILTALAAHRGEIVRNDYRRMVRARAEMNATLGAELLFGFGSRPDADVRYVELLTEAVRVDARWLLGRARWLDCARPLPDPSDVDITGWLDAESVGERFGAPGSQGRA
jgi:LmbE family N-acetylglucosaminyl deacetylase